MTCVILCLGVLKLMQGDDFYFLIFKIVIFQHIPYV